MYSLDNLYSKVKRALLLRQESVHLSIQKRVHLGFHMTYLHLLLDSPPSHLS